MVAAWLCQYPQKMIIAPKEWFKNAPAVKHIIPDNWMRF